MIGESQFAEIEYRLLESHLVYDLRCLREAATDPALSSVERLARVLDRTKRIREIREQLTAARQR